jgi:hypothetical protein
MTWEIRYLVGGNIGYENTETKDFIYTTKRNEWEVILNNKTIKRNLKNENEANTFMNEYIKAN